MPLFVLLVALIGLLVMFDPQSLKSSSTGYLQPPITWEELPDVVQQGILKLPYNLWQTAIDRFAYELHWYRSRLVHERFIASLQQTMPVSGDTLHDLTIKHEKHQELLQWHHQCLHPEIEHNKPRHKFTLKQFVITCDGRTGLIVGVYWRLWSKPGWSYLVEWDQRTGDGAYYQEVDLSICC